MKRDPGPYRYSKTELEIIEKLIQKDVSAQEIIGIMESFRTHSTELRIITLQKISVDAKKTAIEKYVKEKMLTTIKSLSYDQKFRDEIVQEFIVSLSLMD